MVSRATQSSKPYTRLIHVAKCVFDNDRVLTDSEKEDFANAICDAIEPYDACYEMGDPNAQWESISENYREMDEIDVVGAWLYHVGHATLEDYIINEGLPIPNVDDMVDRIFDSIDLEEYINEDDIWIEWFFEELIRYRADENIIELFAEYVKAGVYDD